MLDDARVFEAGHRVTVVQGGTSRLTEIEYFRKQHGRAVIKLKGIDSIDQAELLVGAELEIPAEDLPAPENDSFYTFELKGCRVTAVNGEELGTITEVLDWGAAPLLKLDSGAGEILIPFAKAYLRTVDLPNRHIVVDLPEGLRDLNK
jgi:16S rRNA processing protein RimM